VKDVAFLPAPVELRVLNGLHRGAVLPLDGQVIHIGSDDSNDIVLLDNGIEARHASIQFQENSQWVIQYLPESQPIPLALGDCASIGEVRLMLAEEGSPWRAPEPSAPPPSKNPGRSWASQVTLLLAILLGALSCGGMALWWAQPDEPPARPVTAPTPSSTPPGASLKSYPAPPAPLATQLPFRLQTIQAGPEGFVVTENGVRLNPGESLQGYTLQSIQPHVVVFGGKEHIELLW